MTSDLTIFSFPPFFLCVIAKCYERCCRWERRALISCVILVFQVTKQRSSYSYFFLSIRCVQYVQKGQWSLRRWHCTIPTIFQQKNVFVAGLPLSPREMLVSLNKSLHYRQTSPKPKGMSLSFLSSFCFCFVLFCFNPLIQTKSCQSQQ